MESRDKYKEQNTCIPNGELQLLTTHSHMFDLKINTYMRNQGRHKAKKPKKKKRYMHIYKLITQVDFGA